MVELPRIAGVERTVEKIRLLGFGQHEEIVLHFAQLRRSLLPEGRGHQHGHIAAEPVHAVLREPEAHGVDLPLPHGAVGVVELGRVVPAVGHDRLARRVALVPVGRTLGHPPRVARRVVGHPVEQHFQPQPVRRRHEAVEIGHRPEFGIDAAVVAHGVVGAQRPLAVRLADRVDRHQPHGVDAHVAQEAELRGGGPEGTFARQLAHVHFIDYSLVAPLGMQHNLRILIRNRIPGRQMYVFFRKKSVLRPNRVKMGQNSWAGGYVYFIKNYYLCARYKTPYTKTKRSK